MVHQEMASATAVSGNVERPKTRHDFITSLRARDIGTIRQHANRLNKRALINTRLSRAKILSGPLENICKVELCHSTEADAPFPVGHWTLFGCF